MSEWLNITSRKNENVLLAASLSEKKNRKEAGLFAFEGIKLLREAIIANVKIESVFATQKALKIYENDFSRLSANIKKYQVTDDVYRKFTEENAPQGVFIVARHIDKSVKFTTIYKKEENSVSQRILLCNELRDPGNVGTVIRCAAAMGVGRLVFSEDCADLYHPKTIRGAMGALFRQRIDLTNDMAAYIHSLQKGGYRVMAAALGINTEVLGERATERHDCYLIGNEGHGLPAELIAKCDGVIRIPMEKGNESYNAAMAATLLMWEGYRSELLHREF